MNRVKLKKSFIGAEIRGLRAKNNISQNTLANELKIDLLQLKKLENGFKMPSLIEIVSICNFFNIYIEEFLEYKHIWIAE
ncbi:MAG: helix-turn-helix domain-containing protein [Bacilli bacterium]